MNDRLHIAAILLGHLISTDQGKQLRARLPEVHHCLALADLLIGQCECSPAVSVEPEINIEDNHRPAERRPTPPMLRQIYERRAAALQESKTGRGPTRH